jgi:UDP-N-acetylmuramoylalanine--D-glutamate ligase
MRALVYGLGVTGAAVGDALHRRGIRSIAADDAMDDAKRTRAESWADDLVVAPDESVLTSLLGAVDMVCPAPGVPETHRVITRAEELGVVIRSELDLAYEWEQQRPGGPRPMVAVTGTDGKTTTTMMAAAMLSAAGHRAVAVGNTEVPLVAEIDGSADVFVVECSSFRLAFATSFRPDASVWLNLADDHQNWHRSMASYERAKARMWAYCRPTDVAIGSITDSVVMSNLRTTSARRLTFGPDDADYTQRNGAIATPHGAVAEVASMSRSLPHDITNAMAAAAICLESGLVQPDAVARALTTFTHPPHRIQPVAEIDGVRWYNDSKATTPHAALTAIRSFERVVLLAGGLNKGLDLDTLAGESQRIVGVVALGAAAGDIEAAFHDVVRVVRADSMEQAVDAASAMARTGDVVLLSPACASFDWYPTGGYPARGEHFMSLVHELAARSSV